MSFLFSLIGVQSMDYQFKLEVEHLSENQLRYAVKGNPRNETGKSAKIAYNVIKSTSHYCNQLFRRATFPGAGVLCTRSSVQVVRSR